MLWLETIPHNKCTHEYMHLLLMVAVYTNYRVLLILQVDQINIPVHAAHDYYVSM